MARFICCDLSDGEERIVNLDAVMQIRMQNPPKKESGCFIDFINGHWLRVEDNLDWFREHLFEKQATPARIAGVATDIRTGGT